MTSNSASSAFASLKATLVGGVPTGNASSGVHSLTATLRGVGDARIDSQPVGLEPVDLDGTMFHDPDGALLDKAGKQIATSAGRTTVLPRRRKNGTAAESNVEQRARFDRVRTLGQGGMGQVELARDNDIRRTVALKRIHAEAGSDAALLRFADEIRVVGQLEHPGIVPIYDVGRDDDGRVYLVMKHLHGETMEDVLEKLRENDNTCRERFPIEHRVRLFLGILDAVRYAHARGILHRDLKPANVQIGPYGEVTVMDWGIAKPIRRSEGTPVAEPLDRTLIESHDQRLLETQFGSLAGTPLYMSPEQAAGRNDELDERSDVYALCVLFYEWLTLEHPLKGKATISEVLAAIISEKYNERELFNRAVERGVPIEYIWIAVRGLQQDRKQRYQSVAELETAIQEVLEGRVEIKCHVTLGKSAALAFANWIDHHVLQYTLLFGFLVLSALTALGFGMWALIHALS